MDDVQVAANPYTSTRQHGANSGCLGYEKAISKAVQLHPPSSARVGSITGSLKDERPSDEGEIGEDTRRSPMLYTSAQTDPKDDAALAELRKGFSGSGEGRAKFLARHFSMSPEERSASNVGVDWVLYKPSLALI